MTTIYVHFSFLNNTYKWTFGPIFLCAFCTMLLECPSARQRQGQSLLPPLSAHQTPLSLGALQYLHGPEAQQAKGGGRRLVTICVLPSNTLLGLSLQFLPSPKAFSSAKAEAGFFYLFYTYPRVSLSTAPTHGGGEGYDMSASRQSSLDSSYS